MGNDDWRKLLCPKCHQLKTTCTCTRATTEQSTVVRVGRERKAEAARA